MAYPKRVAQLAEQGLVRIGMTASRTVFQTRVTELIKLLIMGIQNVAVLVFVFPAHLAARWADDTPQMTKG